MSRLPYPQKIMVMRGLYKEKEVCTADHSHTAHIITTWWETGSGTCHSLSKTPLLKCSSIYLGMEEHLIQNTLCKVIVFHIKLKRVCGGK